MPYEIKMEVILEVEFLQVVNTTIYATTMDFSTSQTRKVMAFHIIFMIEMFVQFPYDNCKN
jgi:hypothetical protein